MSIGSTLREAREARGLTAADLAESTRIREALIADIENDEFRRCGGDAYARGHVKVLAKTLGLDPIDAARQFDAQLGLEVPTASTPAMQARQSTQPANPAEPTQPTWASKAAAAATPGTAAASRPVSRLAPSSELTFPGSGVRERRVSTGPNWSLAMLIALIVVLGLGAYSFVSSRGSASVVADPAPVRSTPVAAPTGSPAASPTPTPVTSVPATTPTDPGPVAVVPGSGVTVVVSVTDGKSWISVRSSNSKTLFEGLLTSGERRTFKDDALVKLTVGNAGAVSLKVNGRELGSPGGSGQVVKVSFGPGDPAAAGSASGSGNSANLASGA